MWEALAQEKRSEVDASTKKVRIFEHDVERAYVSRLRHLCMRQQEEVEQRIRNLSGIFGIGADWDEIRRLQKEPIESCQLFDKYRYQVGA